MPDIDRDPVVQTLRYAFGMMICYNLDDAEAAIYAAAFTLCGPRAYLKIAREAVYYNSHSAGKFRDSVVAAKKMRTEKGIIGTMKHIAD